MAHGSRETRQSPLATPIANQRLVLEIKHALNVMRECRGGELFDRYIADPVAVHVQMIGEAIFFVDECDKSDVKIIDFGVAKVLKRFGSLRALCGTPHMVPKVFGGDYPPAADVWRVGVIACGMVFALPTFCVSPGKYYDTSETKENKLILKSSAKVKVRFHPRTERAQIETGCTGELWPAVPEAALRRAERDRHGLYRQAACAGHGEAHGGQKGAAAQVAELRQGQGQELWFRQRRRGEGGRAAGRRSQRVQVRGDGAVQRAADQQRVFVPCYQLLFIIFASLLAQSVRMRGH